MFTFQFQELQYEGASHPLQRAGGACPSRGQQDAEAPRPASTTRLGCVVRANQRRTGREVIMKLLRLPEVVELVRLGKSTIYQMVKEQRFPAPLKQGSGNFWIDIEIDQYLEKLALARVPNGSTAQKP
jgi:prophage regulatory protein